MFKQQQTMGTENNTGSENNIRLRLTNKERLKELRRIRNLCWEYDKRGADALDDCIQELEQRC